MKKLIVMMMLVLPIVAWGQKISKNEIDKFTKQSIIETTVEKIADFNKWKSLLPDPSKVSVSIRYVDGSWYMPASIMLDGIKKYTEEDGIILLLDDGSTIDLKTLYTGIGADEIGIGGVLHTFHTVFNLTNEDVDKLRKNKLASVRIRYLGGHKDFECSKSKKDKIMKMIILIDDAIKK